MMKGRRAGEKEGIWNWSENVGFVSHLDGRGLFPCVKLLRGAVGSCNASDA